VPAEIVAVRVAGKLAELDSRIGIVGLAFDDALHCFLQSQDIG
jgi:hypothetical protein